MSVIPVFVKGCKTWEVLTEFSVHITQDLFVDCLTAPQKQLAAVMPETGALAWKKSLLGTKTKRKQRSLVLLEII